MWILITGLVLLGIIALIAGIIRNKRLEQKIAKGELDRMPEVKEVDVECCGQHEICEKESLLAAVSKKIEYYDDDQSISRCIVYHARCRCRRMDTQSTTSRS